MNQIINTEASSSQNTRVKEPENIWDNLRSFNIFKKWNHQLTGFRHKHKQILEQTVNVDDELNNSDKKRLTLPPPEILYNRGGSQGKVDKFYQHFEDQLICSSNDKMQFNLKMITKESYNKILNQGYTFIHLGIILVSIQVTTRIATGVMASVTFVDHSWKNPLKAIIAQVPIMICFIWLVMFLGSAAIDSILAYISG